MVPACDAAIASQKTPTTGTVTGDTWLDFRRAYGRSATIWFVVDEFGGEDPIQGSVYQNGIVAQRQYRCAHVTPVVSQLYTSH